jgi:hypothetical protein
MHISNDQANSPASSLAGRGPALGLLVALLTCVLGLFVGSGVAVAARSHAFSLAFGSAGSGAGELSLETAPRPESPGSGLGANDTTHDVYAADTGNRRVDEFTPKGEFIRAWGWGVATGAAELQVCTSSCKAGLSGTEPGEFEAPSYVVVDNGPSSASKGDVYVADTGDNLVTKFDAEGHLIASWGNNGENAKKEHTEPNGQLNGSPTEVFNGGHNLELIAGIGVDGAGNLWVYDGTEQLFEFAQNGAFLFTCRAPSVGAQQGGIGLSDSCTENCGINVLSGFRLGARLTEQCGRSGFVTSGGEFVKSLAVDGSNGDIYVDREGLRIEDIPSSCTPSPVGCQPSQIFGEESGLSALPPPPLSEATGITVDRGSGAVYVANSGTQQIVRFSVAVEATLEPTTSVLAHTAVLHGSVNPSGAQVTECRFEYGPSTGYGKSAPCEQSLASIGQGTNPVPVSADIEDLDGTTAYHYRIHAANSQGIVNSEDGRFETLPTAVVTSLAVSELGPSSALLTAKVNPGGLAAEYHFEYGPCEPAGDCGSSPFTTSVPVPDGMISAGAGDVEESQHIEGLSPDTTYHFRISVTDANGPTTPRHEATFVYAPEAPACTSSRPAADQHLGDCRAYEMVTPPDKDGALINNGAFLITPSLDPDGSRIFSKSIQCFHSPSSCTGIRQTEGQPFSFERSPAGWQTTPLAPPIAAGSTMLGYSAETDLVLYSLAAEPPSLEQFYVRSADGTLTAIGPIGEAPGVQVAKVASSLRVGTSDLNRLVYQVRGLWPSLEGGAINENLFEYAGTGNSSPTLVAVTGPQGSKSLIGACGSSLGGSFHSQLRNEYNSLSADGRTVFFTVAPCASGTGVNTGVSVPAYELYARIEQAGGMSTIPVSAPGGGK